MFAGVLEAAGIAGALAFLPAAYFLLTPVYRWCRVFREKRRREVECSAEQALAPFLAGREGLVLAAVEAAEEYGFRVVAGVLRRARRRRGGECREISSVLEILGEVERLGERLSSPRPRTRLAGVLALGECGGDLAISYLSGMMADEDEVVRSTAVHLLSESGMARVDQRVLARDRARRTA